MSERKGNLEMRMQEQGAFVPGKPKRPGKPLFLELKGKPDFQSEKKKASRNGGTKVR